MKILNDRNIIVGIKVLFSWLTYPLFVTFWQADTGLRPLPGSGEVTTQGIDNLDERCKKFYARGARFAKWRSVFKIKDKLGATPSEVGNLLKLLIDRLIAIANSLTRLLSSNEQLAIQDNIVNMARYAAICQRNGLVPILEPEVLMDGDFDIHVSARATQRVLSSLFNCLVQHHVLLEAIVLKPNMVRSGVHCEVQAPSDVIGHMTVMVMQRCVPVAVPGIAFLSGGMTEEAASLALNAINTSRGPRPWY